MSKNNGSDLWLFNDWLYLILIILTGAVLLGINLGVLEKTWIAYWPVLLIIVGIKEILERR